LEFALIGKEKDFHYISTLSVALFDMEIEENEGKEDILITEYCHEMGQSYERVYTRSKLEAEKKVLSYRARGLNASIYRIGRVGFHSETGKFQKNIEESALYIRLKAIISLGLLPELVTLSLGHVTFVDYLARAIAAIITGLQFSNETFHINNPAELLAQNLKPVIPLKKVSFEEFLLFLDSSIEDPGKRPLIEGLLLHYGMFDRFIRNKRFVRTVVVKDRTDRILKELGFEWPGLDDEHIKKMIMHCKEVGFLK